MRIGLPDIKAQLVAAAAHAQQIEKERQQRLVKRTPVFSETKQGRIYAALSFEKWTSVAQITRETGLDARQVSCAAWFLIDKKMASRRITAEGTFFKKEKENGKK